MSAFARKQLEKFGWKEGSGLGKEGTGINTFLKVNRRVAGLMSGIGHSAGSGTVNDDMGLGSALKNMGKDKKKNKKRAREGQDGGADDGNDSSDYFEDSEAEVEEKKSTKKSSSKKVVEEESSASSSSSSSSSDSSSSDSDSDEDDGTDIMKWDDKKLFAKCGGVRLSSRTGRHRVFNGKLARIEAAKEGKAVPLKKAVEKKVVEAEADDEEEVAPKKKASKKQVSSDSDSD